MWSHVGPESTCVSGSSFHDLGMRHNCSHTKYVWDILYIYRYLQKCLSLSCFVLNVEQMKGANEPRLTYCFLAAVRANQTQPVDKTVIHIAQTLTPIKLHLRDKLKDLRSFSLDFFFQNKRNQPVSQLKKKKNFDSWQFQLDSFHCVIFWIVWETLHCQNCNDYVFIFFLMPEVHCTMLHNLHLKKVLISCDFLLCPKSKCLH